MNEQQADDLSTLDPIEVGLRELISAEQANLFNQTKVDTRALLMTPSPVTPIWKRMPIGIVASAAAAIVMAVGIGGYMFSSELHSLRQQSTTGQYAIQTNVDQSDCDGNFFECVAGPSHVVMGNCDRFDYDLDGDVDLTDIKTYQLNCNGITQ